MIAEDEPRANHLRKAAKILLMGELGAGHPPTSSIVWEKLRQEAEGFLGEALDKPETTNGDPALSKQAHAKEALELLRDLSIIAAVHLPQMKRKSSRDWLREVMADVAISAFQAGKRVQAVWGKDIESHAVRGMTTLRAAQAGGESRKGEQAEDTKMRLAEMKRLIDAGRSIRSAAEALSRNNIGASASANLQLWHCNNPRRKL